MTPLRRTTCSNSNAISTSQHSVQLTPAQRRAIAELLPELASRLKIDQKSSRAIRFIVSALESTHRKAKDAISRAEDGTKQNSLRHVVNTTADAIEKSRGIGLTPASERLYQFKITLIDSEPAIWRRITIDSQERAKPCCLAASVPTVRPSLASMTAQLARCRCCIAPSPLSVALRGEWASG